MEEAAGAFFENLSEAGVQLTEEELAEWELTTALRLAPPPTALNSNVAIFGAGPADST